jgi:hypothetical protein
MRDAADGLNADLLLVGPFPAAGGPPRRMIDALVSLLTVKPR